MSDDLCRHLKNLSALPLIEETSEGKLPELFPAVRTGVLNNGLTYYVLSNKEPKARAELQLIVGFGSLVEEDSEQGIAHIIEHLGFHATKNFQKHSLVKYLESIGAPFGACQNAYTSFDETVYH